MRTQPETIKESGVPWICLSNSSPENNAVISLVEDLLFDAHSLHGLQKSLQLCHCYKYLLFNLLRFHKLVGVKKNTEKNQKHFLLCLQTRSVNFLRILASIFRSKLATVSRFLDVRP